MKRCTKCGETKAVGEFHKHRGGKDGLRSHCKACVKARKARYRAAHPAKEKARHAKYRAENAEKIKAGDAKYRAARPMKARQAKYYAANAEKMKARQAKWWAAHPEKVGAYKARRRARKLGADGDATTEQIAARWEVYGGTCYICGCPAEATDHVKPLAAGGSNWPANLRPICTSCNCRKGATWPYSPVTTKAIVSSSNGKGASRSLWRVR